MRKALLTRAQLAHCKRIAGRDDVHGQHASALLAVHSGKFQAQAAAASGLTPGQVRYWVGKFRSDGMGIFPADIRTAPRRPAKAPQSKAAKPPAKRKPTAKKKAKKKPKPKPKKKKDKKKKAGAGKKKKGKKSNKPKKGKKKPPAKKAKKKDNKKRKGRKKKKGKKKSKK